jgi:hypothetical protein
MILRLRVRARCEIDTETLKLLTRQKRRRRGEAGKYRGKDDAANNYAASTQGNCLKDFITVYCINSHHLSSPEAGGPQKAVIELVLVIC